MIVDRTHNSRAGAVSALMAVAVMGIVLTAHSPVLAQGAQGTAQRTFATPEDAVRLMNRCRDQGGESIVFAERTRRTESVLFKVLYKLYQFLHWVLTGIRVRVGNFSIVPVARRARGQVSSIRRMPSRMLSSKVDRLQPVAVGERLRIMVS